ncbi:helix-turn-helix DNA-binding protein [Gordonia phage Dogfish]|nr:helix-turn-helix DNA-binding protein [Gordonia phage Dogfish]
MTRHVVPAYLRRMSNRHIHSESATSGADDLLTTRQIATEWHVSVRTVQRYIASGRLPAVRLPGGQRRIRRADVDELLKASA